MSLTERSTIRNRLFLETIPQIVTEHRSPRACPAAPPPSPMFFDGKSPNFAATSFAEIYSTLASKMPAQKLA